MNSTKSTILKGFVFLLVFIFSFVVFEITTNKGKTDTTSIMPNPTLPIVYIEQNNKKINAMHGYVKDMEYEYIRNNITQIQNNRLVPLLVETFDTNILSISYELRALTDNRLIESNEISDIRENKGEISIDIVLKDLIEPETEYTFILCVTLQNGEEANYYTRIVQTDSYFMKEKTAFVEDFSQKTFDKKEALGLTKYLESDNSGDNSTFNSVNIHSSFAQITWGDLKVTQLAKPEIQVVELSKETGSFSLTYPVKVADGQNGKTYFVKEFYRVRYTNERVYLLDFERTMTQQFELTSDSFANNKCLLGITSPDINITESEDGKAFAFIQNNQIFSVITSNNKVARVYGFQDNYLQDIRYTYDNHKIKILSCDEGGNIYFMVYGYLNRGSHEGEVGIQVYSYGSTLNTIEELVFIPYTKSAELLIYNVDQLAFLSKENKLYLSLNNSLCAIDIETQTYEILTENLLEGSFKVSDSNETVVWLVGTGLYSAKTMQLINLNTQKTIIISAEDENRVLPLGFMGEDLLYGEAAATDIVEDQAGNMVFPMKKIKIENSQGDILKTYEKPDIYVTGCDIGENQITLMRVLKNEATGLYEPTENDQIVNNTIVTKGKNELEEVVTQLFEKQIQIIIKEKLAMNKILFSSPKEVLYEGNRIANVDFGSEDNNRFYVYSEGKLVKVTTDAGLAVAYADNCAGTVVNDYGIYIWYKGNLSTRNQIMAITAQKITENKNSVVVCLDTILANQGIMRNSETFIAQGKSVLSILREQLPKAQILDLTGCSLQETLFFLNQDIPVLALLNDNTAVLVTGFNSNQVVIMNPVTGELYKKGMTDAALWFEKNGNMFITYISIEQ